MGFHSHTFSRSTYLGYIQQEGAHYKKQQTALYALYLQNKNSNMKYGSLVTLVSSSTI